MATKIDSLSQLVVKLNSVPDHLKQDIGHAIQRSVVKIQATAKLKFGHYQAAVGKFPAWEELSEEYKKEKMKHGGEDPLIGHYKSSGGNSVYPTSLRNSILTKVSGLIGYVGTNNPLMEYHEFGTTKMPPRPVMRPALFQEKEFVRKEIRKAIAKTMSRL